MYRSSKKPARKNRTGFRLNPGHPFGRLPNRSGTASHEQYTTREPEKSSPPGKKSPQRVKTAPIPRRARRRAVFTRCGQWESGGGTKQGTGSPAAQPRASPEPPAGAAGTGGAQGRSQRKRTRPHATCRVRFTFFGLSTGRRKPRGGGHAAEPAHGKAPRKTRPKASPRGRGRAEKTPRGRGGKSAPQGRNRPRGGSQPPPKPRSGRPRGAPARGALRKAAPAARQGRPQEARSPARARRSAVDASERRRSRAAAHKAERRSRGAGGEGRARGAKRGRYAPKRAREAAAGAPRRSGRATGTGAAAREVRKKPPGAAERRQRGTKRPGGRRAYLSGSGGDEWSPQATRVGRQ